MCLTGWWGTRFAATMGQGKARSLRAGRVQTVALRFIVERKKEIRAFNKQEYRSIDATLGGESSANFDAQFTARRR